MGHDGRHVENAAIAGALHVGHEGLAHEEDAGDVGVLDGAPFFEREILDVLAVVGAGVVDEDLDFADGGGDFLLQFHDLVFLGDVGGEDRGSSPDRANFFGDRFQLLLIACHQNQVGSLRSESDRHGAAKALAGAGDEGVAPE